MVALEIICGLTDGALAPQELADCVTVPAPRGSLAVQLVDVTTEADVNPESEPNSTNSPSMCFITASSESLESTVPECRPECKRNTITLVNAVCSSRSWDSHSYAANSSSMHLGHRGDAMPLHMKRYHGRE